MSGVPNVLPTPRVADTLQILDVRVLLMEVLLRTCTHQKESETEPPNLTPVSGALTREDICGSPLRPISAWRSRDEGRIIADAGRRHGSSDGTSWSPAKLRGAEDVRSVGGDVGGYRAGGAMARSRVSAARGRKWVSDVGGNHGGRGVGPKGHLSGLCCDFARTASQSSGFD